MAMKNIERNARIFESVINGSAFFEAAEAEGISISRVGQIVHWMLRMMRHPKRIGYDAPQWIGDWEISEVRKHAEFWLEQLAKLKIEFGIKE